MGACLGKILPMLSSGTPLCEADNNKIECCVTETVSSSSSEPEAAYDPTGAAALGRSGPQRGGGAWADCGLRIGRGGAALVPRHYVVPATAVACTT